MPETTPTPNNEIRQFAEILIAGTHSIQAIRDEFCVEPDNPIPTPDISTLSETALRELDCAKIVAPDPIRRYLESGEILSDYIIDQLELAIATAANLKDPFYISSMRDGSEEEANLEVRYFYLAIDPELDK